MRKNKSGMQPKTADKLARKERPTWVGYYPRVTPTKAEKQEKLDRKHKKLIID